MKKKYSKLLTNLIVDFMKRSSMEIGENADIIELDSFLQQQLKIS
jgi:hypothetical protein